jgi:hypothetical protein
MTPTEPRYQANDIVAVRGTRTLYRIMYLYPCGECYQLLEHKIFPQRGMVVWEDDIIGGVDPAPAAGW